MCLPTADREVYIRALLAQAVEDRSLPQGAVGCVVEWAVNPATPEALAALARDGATLAAARASVADALRSCIEVASTHPEQLPPVTDAALDDLVEQVSRDAGVDVSAQRDCIRDNGFAKNGLYDAALMACLPAAERGRYIATDPPVTGDGITNECFVAWAEFPNTQVVFAESSSTSPTPTRAHALFTGGVISCLGESFRPAPPTPTAIGGLLPGA
jgi:hypothetical protein